MSQTSEGYSATHRAIIEAMRRVADKSHSLPDEWRWTQLRLLSRLLVQLPTRVSAQEFASTSLWLIGALADMRRENPALAPVCQGLEEELRDAIDLGWQALPGLAEWSDDPALASATADDPMRAAGSDGRPLRAGRH